MSASFDLLNNSDWVAGRELHSIEITMFSFLSDDVSNDIIALCHEVIDGMFLSVVCCSQSNARKLTADRLAQW